MSSSFKVIVVSSAVKTRESLLTILPRQDIDTVCAATISQCRDVLKSRAYSLMFCDRNFPDGDYRDILTLASYKRSKAGPKVVLMCDLLAREDYEHAKRNGIFAMMQIPCHSLNVEWMVILAKRHERMSENGGPIRSQPRNRAAAS